ncbi:hypothetical protein HY639_02680 [Candidatus Woesearchaeota archaeon]|nr:hypothetical protein [Candidatus Woesearchaeota archaeon]
MQKKGQGLPLEVIIVGVVVLIVLVIIILIFTGKMGEFRVKSEEVGSLERFAGGELDVDGSCSLEVGLGTCRTSCQQTEKIGKYASTAKPGEKCKLGLSCCTGQSQ